MKKPEPKIHTYNSWRKRYKCKRNKGDHTFEIVYASMLPNWWFDNKKIIVDKQCTACGKQAVEFVV